MKHQGWTEETKQKAAETKIAPKKRRKKFKSGELEIGNNCLLRV